MTVTTSEVTPQGDWVSRSCPLCGSDDERAVFADAEFSPERLDDFAFASRKTPDYMHYRLVACGECDLLYATPVPPEDRLFSAYRDAAFDSVQEAGFASRTYARLLSRVVAALPDRVGALDIGTGDGSFLRELCAAGFSNVVGVEPSIAPIRTAGSDVRPLIRHGMFEAANFEADTFSLVTCFQTVEHIYQPLALCRGVHRILKKGGAALFVCHNRRSVSASLLGLKSPIFDIEHLQLFSPRSARALFERAGFVDISARPIWNRYPLSYWIKLFPMPTALKRFGLSVLMTTRLGNVPIPLPAGNTAAAGFKR